MSFLSAALAQRLPSRFKIDIVQSAPAPSPVSPLFVIDIPLKIHAHPRTSHLCTHASKSCIHRTTDCIIGTESPSRPQRVDLGHACPPEFYPVCGEATIAYNNAYRDIECHIRDTLRDEQEQRDKKKVEAVAGQGEGNGEKGKEEEEEQAAAAAVIGQYDGADAAAEGEDELESGAGKKRGKGSKERAPADGGEAEPGRKSGGGCDDGQGSQHWLTDANREHDVSSTNAAKRGKDELGEMRRSLIKHYARPFDKALRVNQANDRVIKATYTATENRNTPGTGMVLATATQHRGTGFQATSFAQWLICRKYRPKDASPESKLRKYFIMDLAATSAGPIVEGVMVLALRDSAIRESLKYVFKKQSFVLLVEQCIREASSEEPYDGGSAIISNAAAKAAFLTATTSGGDGGKGMKRKPLEQADGGDDDDGTGGADDADGDDGGGGGGDRARAVNWLKNKMCTTLVNPKRSRQLLSEDDVSDDKAEDDDDDMDSLPDLE